MKKITSIALASALFSGVLMAENAADFQSTLKQMAGPTGPFAQTERFPKDYFLVPHNLPFLVGLTLHHPKSGALELSDEQKARINAIKDKTVPEVVRLAKEIKAKELLLADRIALQKQPAEELYSLVDGIGLLRLKLTKAHLNCINQVQKVLTDDQYRKVMDYAKSR